MISHPLQCRCGRLTGQVTEPQKGSRGVCYCRDCQAFAHFLGNADAVLDEMGGTDVVATLPKYVQLTGGVDALACMSLTERGLLRWYASCCRTAIGNTMRDYRFPYVGLVHTCLGSPAAINGSFGPVRMRVNAKSAKGHPQSMPLSQAAALARFIPTVLLARMNGSYRTTPFFSADGTPVADPKVLTSRELQAARDAI
jgi:hypothetical protein